VERIPYEKFKSPLMISPLHERKEPKYEELREIFEKCGED
jgi:hypothetical protein